MRELLVLLLNGTGNLVTKAREKAKVLNTFFASVFAGETSLQESPVPETRGKVWSKEDLPSAEENQIKEHLSKLDIHKSMGPDHGLAPVSADQCHCTATLEYCALCQVLH